MKKKLFSILIFILFAISFIGYVLDFVGVALHNQLLCNVGLLIGACFALAWYICCQIFDTLYNREVVNDKK